MYVIEHHIQREIIDRLMHAPSLRFSELKPAGMESNIFMYHVKQLVREGFVAKNDTGYHLASKGLSYVDGLSQENNRPRKQPKLIAIIALHDGHGRWLLAERKVQPYIHTRMFPSGKQHQGETGAEHAARELHEKTGLDDVVLQYAGLADIQITDVEATLLTHVVAHVYTGQVASDVLPQESDRFRYVWHDFTQDAAKLMPGTAELQRQLLSSDPFNITIAAQQM